MFFMPYFYILYSPSLDGHYVGHTEQLPEERLQKHLTNHKGYTSKLKDWAVVHVELYETKEEAYKRERQVKAWKSKKKITELIQNGM